MTSLAELLELYRKNEEALNQYKTFEAPKGVWRGELDFTMPHHPKGAFCFFTAQVPKEIKGKKFRLFAGDPQRIDLSGCANILDEDSGLYELKTDDPPEGCIYPRWESARRLA